MSGEVNDPSFLFYSSLFKITDIERGREKEREREKEKKRKKERKKEV
jgi:hypothetical protein